MAICSGISAVAPKQQLLRITEEIGHAALVGWALSIEINMSFHYLRFRILCSIDSSSEMSNPRTLGDFLIYMSATSPRKSSSFWTPFVWLISSNRDRAEACEIPKNPDIMIDLN